MTDNNAQKCELREKNILIAVDGSDNARKAVLYVAGLLGGLEGFRITLFHVIPLAPEDYFPSAEERTRWIVEKRREADQALVKYRRILEGAGMSASTISTRISEGTHPSAAEAILSAQRDLGCCTLVMGRRGLSKKEEFIFGSTSNRILHAEKNCALWIIE